MNPSLQQLCLHQIAKDIDLWCSKELEYRYQEPDGELGPFGCLGSRQIHELLAILIKANNNIKRFHLAFLLHRRITFLDLNHLRRVYFFNDYYLSSAIRRCQQMTSLSAAHMDGYNITTRMLRKIPEHLPNLQNLDISWSRPSDDSVLVSIDEHCKDLEVLNLEYCENVTDCGLKALKSNTKLVEINLSATSITGQGALVLLQNHPQLQTLSLSKCSTKKGPYFHINKRAEYFNDSYLSLGVTHLRYLDISCTSADAASIVNISKICPELSTLCIDRCSNLDGKCLSHIQTMAHLKHLHFDGTSISLSTELPAFLKKSGNQLRTLHLPMSTNLDMGIIGHFCPNLTSLSLAKSEYLKGSLTKCDSEELTLMEACPYLQSLDLHRSSFCSSKSLREHFSEIFCKNANNLEELNISYTGDAAYEYVLEHIGSPCFSNLRILNISICGRINKDVLLNIVRSCRHLQCLVLHHSISRGRGDFEELTQLLERLGRYIDIDWSYSYY